MARIRSLKPEFFKHPELGELPIATRYFFAGLWCQADKEGRLKDRPKVLALEIVPWDNLDAEKPLAELDAAGFIQRYEVDGERYISIRHFAKHQKPHPKEAPSEIPPPPPRVKPAVVKAPGVSGQAVELNGNAEAVKLNGKTMASKVVSGLLSSFPLVSGSLSSSPMVSGEKQKLAQGSLEKPSDTPAQRKTRTSVATWEAYSAAYQARYHVEPVRNARVNAQLAYLVQELGRDVAPQVAAFYVRHQDAQYVRDRHGVKLLVRDCAKLRTDWLRGEQMTGTSARIVEKSRSNLESWNELLSEKTNVDRG